MITASMLFAPDRVRDGMHRCFYCGASCGDDHSKKEYVKKTFTNRDIVKFPGSNYVCGPCVESLATVTQTKLVDGDIKTGRGAAPRTYSWVLDGKNNRAFSKKHFDFARSIIGCPPEPPFSIVLADSGKKQIIFRAPVNYDRDVFVVQFEEAHVCIKSSSWEYYLNTATIASAAIGKKMLSAPNQFSCFLNTVTLYGTEAPLEEWIKIHNEPMSKVASWVCKGKKDARDEDIVSSRISAEISGCSRREEHAAEQRTAGKDETNRSQLLFDFA